MLAVSRPIRVDGNDARLIMAPSSAVSACEIGASCAQAVVTATLFLRTNLHPKSVGDGQVYFGVIFFSLIMVLFDGFAEETLTVRPQPYIQPATTTGFHDLLRVTAVVMLSTAFCDPIHCDTSPI